MSAFIVEDRTINRVLTFLDRDRDYFWKRAEILKVAQADTLADLGASMAFMNCEAVNARYQESKLPDYQFQYEGLVSKYQALKSLACWLYQCSEGSVPERPLYKAFDELKADLAYDIASDLPQYQAAEWA